MKKVYPQALMAILLLLNANLLNAQDFVNPLSIPPLINSNTLDYHLNMIETSHNFNPNGTDTMNTLIRTFAFEDADNPGTTTILGPSIAWQFNNQLTPKVTNNLTEQTTCHWHGAHLPQFADGGPHQLIQPGDTWAPSWLVMDKSATMWYHPHAMDLTYEHVQMGLSGMIYVEDPDDEDPILGEIHDILPVEYGIDDIPLIFQTKKFQRNANNEIEIQSGFPGFKSDYLYLVNGIMDPVLEAPASMIRLRILNGDGKFAFNLELRSNNEPDYFHLIATDAGYTDRSYEMDKVLMAPGERTEWLLDLRGREGDTLYIRNMVSGIPAGVIGDNATTDGYAVDRDLLRIIVGPDTQPPSPILSFPIPLYPSEIPDLSEVTRTRFKTFRKDPFLIDGSTKNLYNIDSSLMNMMVVNDVVKLDSTEIWTLDNASDRAHPFHIHDIHFWVTEVIDGNGASLPPDDFPQIFKGPKDNVLVQKDWTLSFITTFSDFGTEIKADSSYMFHCHILPHEDKGMMGQFVVWNGLGNPPSSTADPALSNRPMNLYPNPTQGFLYLQGSSEAKSKIRISDLQGRLLREIALPVFDGAVGLKVGDLTKGILVLEWLSQEGRAVSKVVME